MPRAATTTDVFNAIAERRRREIIALLAVRAHAVGEIVDALRLPQPAVSKHLGVLRRVGVVSASRDGQRRVYELRGEALRPVHEWVRAFERFWTHQLSRVKQRAERIAAERAARGKTEKQEDRTC